MSQKRESIADVYRFFFRAYPKRSILMIALMVAAGAAEGLGVLTLIPVLESADQGGPVTGLGAAVRATVAAVGLEPSLVVLLSLIVLTVTAKAIFLLLAQRQVGFTTARVVRDLRLQLMRVLFQARWSYFLSRGPGRFAQSVAQEASRAATTYQESCAVIAALLQMAAYFAVAMMISVNVALAALATGLLLTLLASRTFRSSRASGRAQTGSARALASRLVDALQGIKPLKAMGREGLVWPLLEYETESLNRSKRQEISAQYALKAFQEPVLAILLAIGLFVTMEIDGQPLSAVLVLAFIFYRLVSHMNTLHMRYQMILVGESAFFALRNDMEEAKAERETSTGNRAFTGMTSGITFEGVRFSYGQSEVLTGVDADIPVGSFVAIHGESGTGKTTLADLLVGLHDPGAGRILVDGTPISEFELGSWRRALGYVPQEMLLFNESIFLNVTLGDPTFTREDAERALRLAGAWDFVAAKPRGLDEPVGERGSMLSGGQRQRVALARALIGAPSLLILDEVTTSLDPATEQEICQTLGRLAGEVTILSISHQTAIRDVADRVFEMREGRLEEVGAVAADARR